MKIDFTLEEWVKMYYNLSLINKMKEMLYEDMLSADKNYDSDKLIELIVADIDELEKNIVLIEHALLEETKEQCPTIKEKKKKDTRNHFCRSVLYFNGRTHAIYNLHRKQFFIYI